MWGNVQLDMLASAALGSFTLWMRLTYGTKLHDGIGQFVDDFRFRVLAKILLFVAIGAITSVIIVGPNTARQAMAAGMAWTSLLGGIATSGARKG